MARTKKPADRSPAAGRSEQFTRNVTDRSDLPPPESLAKLADNDPLPRGMKVELRKVSGPGKRLRITSRTSPIMIGRADGVADVLVDDTLASRYHACINYRDGKFVLSDMGSTNGTQLNDELVGQADLHDGDRIGVGETVIQFAIRKR